MNNVFEKLKMQHVAEMQMLASFGYEPMDIIHNEVPLSVWYKEDEGLDITILAIYCGNQDILRIISNEDNKQIDKIVTNRLNAFRLSLTC